MDKQETNKALQPLVVIVGPTAVGKTRVAIDVARALGGVIISADSRQVYRLMDIGTAKPTQSERELAEHDLIDFLYPDESLSVAVFQAMAYDRIANAHNAARLPILAGGTGQYIRSVTEGWLLPRVAPDPVLRADLEGFVDIYGSATLNAWLQSVDPQAAEAIDWRNVRRVIRALEVYLISGIPISVQQGRKAPPYRILTIGLTRSRSSLYARIDARVEEMVKRGLLSEIQNLLEAGYGWDLPSMSSLGYSQFSGYFRGSMGLDEAIQAVKRETRRFVRQQYTWFRLDDNRIHWFDLDYQGAEAVILAVRDWLGAYGRAISTAIDDGEG